MAPEGSGTQVDALAEIEALDGFAPRAPGSDAERRAAAHLAGRLEALGRSVTVEAIDTWRSWEGALALAAALGALAGPLSVASAEAGLAVTLAGLLAWVVDGGGLAPLTRRLFGRRVSQNVVSLAREERSAALFLVAHVDAGRTGLVHRPGVRRLLARLGRPRRLVGGPLQPVAWALLAAAGGCAARLAGLDAGALTAAQFALTVGLLGVVAILLDVWLSPTVPGATDDASGAALALRLAERLDGGLANLSVNVLLTGAQESMGDGMRAFLRRHRRELPRDRTIFLNLDELGAGELRWTRREGPLWAVRSHPRLTEPFAAAGAAPLDNRAPSDGFRAAYAGYPAVTVTARDELGLSPWHHRRGDLPEHVDAEVLAAAEELCADAIERLDARLGEDAAG
jgi:hypothetical protein